VKKNITESSEVIRSIRTVSLAILGSRVLGLIREQVLAALFGAHREFDAFITAFRIPNLLRDLFAEGALSAAFVSTFTQKLTTEGDRSAWRLANLVLNALLIVLSLITLAGILLAPWLVRLIAPGFANVPGKVELTTTMTRIMFPFLLLVALAALAMGMLNAKKRFGLPASASMMFNLGSIIGGLGFAYLLDPHLGKNAIIGMSIGTLIGGLAQWLIQVPSLRAVGFRYVPILDWRDPGFRRILKLLGPSVVGVAAVQINIFINSWFASYLENGAVTWLNCAFRLMQFPIGVFGVAIGTAALPTISAHAATGDLAQFRSTLARALRLTIFLCLPSACGLAVLAHPIIAVIFQHGKFSAFSAEQTALCLQTYAIGLAGYAAIKVIAPAFYAFGDSRTPMRVSLLAIAINTALNCVFAWKLGWGAPGLSLATALVALLSFLQLLLAMRRRLQRFEIVALLRSTSKIAAASLLMSVATWGAHQRLVAVNRYADLIICLILAAGVFLTTCRLLRVEEWNELVGGLWRKRS